MAREFDVGARLVLRNEVEFRAGTRAAAEGVDEVGAAATRTSASLSLMGRVSNRAEKMLKRLGSATWVGIKRGALGIAVALGAIGTVAIHSALQAQDATAQIAAGIRSTQGAANVTARDINRLSGAVMRYSGIDDELIKRGAGVLLTFTEVRNEVGKGNDVFNQALTLSADLATRFKLDVPNAAKILGKALQDPVRGLSNLRRVGVDFNDQQAAQIKALVASNNLLGAQRLILAELTKEFGGSAAAAGRTGAGPFKIFTETIKNSLETVGRAVLPTITKILPQLAHSLSLIFTGLAPVISEVAGTLGKTLPGILKAVLPAITLLGHLFATLARVAGPIIKVLAGAFTKFLRAILPALKPFLEALAKAMLPILKALAPILVAMAKPLADLLVALTPIIQPIADIITLLLKLAGPIIKAVTAAIGWLIEHVIKPLVKALGWVVERIKDVITWFSKLPGMAVKAGPITGATRSFFSEFLKGNVPPAPGHRALGGPVMAMRPYWVGERGVPELFVPPANGTVVPAEHLAVPTGDEGRWDHMQLGRVVFEPGAVVVHESGDPERTYRAVKQALTDKMARA